MADGVNSAIALPRPAGFGIAAGSGADIAKEAADVIVLEKSLLVLAQGADESRRTICGMLKYVNLTASSNSGDVFSVLGPAFFWPFPPMPPFPLIQNRLYDASQAAITLDNADEYLIVRPRKGNPGNLLRYTERLN